MRDRLLVGTRKGVFVFVRPGVRDAAGKWELKSSSCPAAVSGSRTTRASRGRAAPKGCMRSTCRPSDGRTARSKILIASCSVRRRRTPFGRSTTTVFSARRTGRPNSRNPLMLPERVRVLQTVWRAEDVHVLTDGEIVGVTERGVGKLGQRLDELDQRNVGARLAEEKLRGMHRASVCLDDNRVGSGRRHGQR